MSIGVASRRIYTLEICLHPYTNISRHDAAFRVHPLSASHLVALSYKAGMLVQPNWLWCALRHAGLGALLIAVALHVASGIADGNLVTTHQLRKLFTTDSHHSEHASPWVAKVSRAQSAGYPERCEGQRLKLGSKQLSTPCNLGTTQYVISTQVRAPGEALRGKGQNIAPFSTNLARSISFDVQTSETMLPEFGLRPLPQLLRFGIVLDLLRASKFLGNRIVETARLRLRADGSP